MDHPPTYPSLSPRDWSVSGKLIALVAPLLLLFVLVTAWYFAGTQRLQAVEQQVNSAARSFLNQVRADRKSTRLNSSHSQISYAVFCLKKKKKNNRKQTMIVRSEELSKDNITI